MLGWSDGSGSLGQAEVCVSHTGFHRVLDGDGVWWLTRRRPESRRCGTSAVPLTPGHTMPLAGPTCCLHRQALRKAPELAEPHSTHPGSLFGDMNGGLLGRKKEDCRQGHLLCQLEIKGNNYALAIEPQRQTRAAHQPTVNKESQSERHPTPEKGPVVRKHGPSGSGRTATWRLDGSRSASSQLSLPTSTHATQGQLVSSQVRKGTERDMWQGREEKGPRPLRSPQGTDQQANDGHTGHAVVSVLWNQGS